MSGKFGYVRASWVGMASEYRSPSVCPVRSSLLSVLAIFVILAKEEDTAHGAHLVGLQARGDVVSRFVVGLLGVLLTIGAPLMLRAGLHAYSTDCAVYTTAPCAAPDNFLYPLLQQMAQALRWAAVPYVIISVCLLGLSAGIALFSFAVNDSTWLFHETRGQTRLAYGLMLALGGVFLANVVKLILLPVLLPMCSTSFNSPGVIGLPRYTCTLGSSPQAFAGIPVVALLQAFPTLFLALLVVSVIVSAVGFYLRRQGRAAKAIVQSLQFSPLMIVVAIGVVALLPFVA
jgi:hypothetical protein